MAHIFNLENICIHFSHITSHGYEWLKFSTHQKNTTLLSDDVVLWRILNLCSDICILNLNFKGINICTFYYVG